MKIHKIVEKSIDNKKIFGISFCVKHRENVYDVSSGNLEPEQSYFIASTTKLFITSIVLILKHQSKLNFDDTIGRYLDNKILNGLHHYKGKKYADRITIQHLLSHTSGIPDYFQVKDDKGISWEYELKSGRDRSWTFDDAINRSKSVIPKFIPGKKGMAHYSDTNFQLLGKIIERVCDNSLNKIIGELIVAPLNLSDTYMYSNPNDKTPKNLYFKNQELIIPKAMSSFWADGGIVSNAHDMLRFIEAFFKGKLFPPNFIENLKSWNNIFFPMQSGIGIHRFKLPWFLDPFGMVPELLGHSGLSGALAFYCPKKEIFIAGTVNQVAYTDQSLRLAIKLINALPEK